MRINSVVKLIIEESNKNQFIGTGSFIRYNNTIFLATAAHCVYDFKTKRRAKKIRILYRSNIFIKQILVKDIFFDDVWRKKGLLSHDFAICTLMEEPKTIHFIYSLDLKKYSSQIKNSKIKMIGLNKNIFSNKENSFYELPNLKFLESDSLIGCPKKMEKGSSGGPVIMMEDTHRIKQIGVISSLLKEYPNYTWGVMWGKNILPILKKAVG